MSGYTQSFKDHLQQSRYYYAEKTTWWFALFVSIGCVVLAAGVIALEQHFQVADPWQFHCCAAAFLVLAVYVAQSLFVQFKVDEHGISQRFHWRWDLWSWDAFAAGSVQDAGLYRYRAPSLPVRCKSLLLAIDDPDDINDLILQVWARPEPEPVPEALTVQMTESFDPPKVDFTPAGLLLTRRKSSSQYAWTDVRRVTIWRSARYRRDFRELEIELPDAKLQFRTFDKDNWKGASREAIAGILQRHVSSRRLGDYSLRGPAVSLDEVDARHERYLPSLKLSEKILPHIHWLLWFGKGISVVFVGAGFGAMFGAYLMVFYALAYFVRRDIKRRTAEYEAQRAALLDAGGLEGDDDKLLIADETESPRKVDAA